MDNLIEDMIQFYSKLQNKTFKQFQLILIFKFKKDSFYKTDKFFIKNLQFVSLPPFLYHNYEKIMTYKIKKKLNAHSYFGTA